jgi:hypothetical protein
VLSIKNKKTIAESFEPSQYNAIVFMKSLLNGNLLSSNQVGLKKSRFAASGEEAFLNHS